MGVYWIKRRRSGGVPDKEKKEWRSEGIEKRKKTQIRSNCKRARIGWGRVVHLEKMNPPPPMVETLLCLDTKHSLLKSTYFIDI